MVQTEFARILADPLESSRQWSREGRKVIGCLDSYISEEFIHAAGMIPLRILGSMGNVTLADSYLPVFAGKLARSILEQGLCGDLAHLAGVATSNSSDAVRMLYDLWGRHIPQHISVRSGVFWLAWMRQATCNTWRSPVFSFIPSAGILEASGLSRCRVIGASSSASRRVTPTT